MSKPINWNSAIGFAWMACGWRPEGYVEELVPPPAEDGTVDLIPRVRVPKSWTDADVESLQKALKDLSKRGKSWASAPGVADALKALQRGELPVIAKEATR